MKGHDIPDFRSWRIGLGLTQEQAALRLGYSRRVMQLYDQGKKEPHVEMILAMTAIWKGITPDEKPWAANHLAPAA
jgi:transcriptional regulator with XRE-family HTH domain